MVVVELDEALDEVADVDEFVLSDLDVGLSTGDD